MKSLNKNNESKMTELEEYFRKRLLSQKKLLKIKLNSIDISPNLKTISHFNTRNSKTKKKNLENSKNNHNYNYSTFRPNTESNIPKKLFSYTQKSKYNYNYNSPELKNDLKKYTNNSVTFRMFKELNKPYHPYSVHRIKTSILLQIKKEKEKEIDNNNKNIIHLNSFRSLLYNNSGISFKKNKSHKNYQNERDNNTFFSKKKIYKLLNEINPVDIPKIYINKDIKDLELNDKIDINFFEDDKLKKLIKKSLLNDINHDEINYKLYYDYLKSIIHQINYYEDIYRVPHIENNLVLCKPFKNIEIFKNKLVNKNLFHSQVTLSMNRIFIIKDILKKKKELKIKKMIEKGEYKLKKKWSNKDESFELKCNEFEKQFQHFELTDYFGKCNNYSFIYFADKKLKNAIFTKK